MKESTGSMLTKFLRLKKKKNILVLKGELRYGDACEI